MWDYRLYASSALKPIHADTTVRNCLELLPREKDLDIKTNLADALLDAGPSPLGHGMERVSDTDRPGSGVIDWLRGNGAVQAVDNGLFAGISLVRQYSRQLISASGISFSS